MAFPRRMTRYVLSELLTPTLLGLMLYVFVLLMNHFFFVAEKSLSKNLGFDLTFRLFMTGVPSIVVLSIPMAVLLGSLIGVGRFSSDHEWVALQGAGQGPWSLLKPLMIHGLLAAAIGAFIYSELVPRSNYTRRGLQAQILMASTLASDLKPRVFYTELQDVVLYVDDIPAGEKTGAPEDAPSTPEGQLRGVLLIQTDRKENSYEVILARSGELYPAADRSGTLIADLFQGVGTRYKPSAPETYYLIHFQSHREPIPPPPYLAKLLEPPDKVISDMPTRELLAEIERARQKRREKIDELLARGREPSSKDTFIEDNRVRVSQVELSSRLALSSASFFFAVLALPLGIRRARSGKGAGFAVSLAVIAIYWSTYTFTRDQSLVGQLPPWLGPWVANFLLVPWAMFGLARMRRPRDDGGGILASVGHGLMALARLPRRLLFSRGERPANDTETALESIGGTSSRFVIRVDQYVGTTYLRVLMFALLSAYLISYLVEVRGLVEGMLKNDQPPVLILRYLQYFSPSILHILLPISCLISAVVAFTLLTRSGELTAIKAAGFSMRRATLPVLVITAMLCGVLYVTMDRVAPVSNRLAQETEDRIMGRAPRTYHPTGGGRWGLGPEGDTLYHYDLYDPDRKEFQGLTVFTIDREEPRIIDHLYAQKAVWRGETATLTDGWYRAFADDTSPGTYEVFEGTREIELDPPAQLVAKQFEVGRHGELAEQLSMSELKDEIGLLQHRGYDTTKLEVAYHGKFARAMAPLVMVLLGLPFAFRVGRRGSLYGVGVAFLLVLVYWAVFAVFNAMGLETLLDPLAAAWAPNIIFGLLGSYLLLYIPT